MKREKLTQAVARENHIGRGEARDQVDELVHKILRALRRGQAVELPGLGKLATPAPPSRGER